MPKDFAARGNTRSKKRKTNHNKRRSSPKQRVLFHAPSFSFGALLGAAIIIVAAYAPEFLASKTPAPHQDQVAVEETPSVEFEFPQLLKQSVVKADPIPYAVEQPSQQSQPASYSMQAASFLVASDANQLRAKLLLQDLPATVNSSLVEGRTWYRVLVGPFEQKVQAERVMTQLRNQNLSAMWIDNYN